MLTLYWREGRDCNMNTAEKNIWWIISKRREPNIIQMKIFNSVILRSLIFCISKILRWKLFFFTVYTRVLASYRQEVSPIFILSGAFRSAGGPVKNGIILKEVCHEMFVVPFLHLFCFVNGATPHETLINKQKQFCF